MDTENNDKITTWCWLTGQFLLYFEQQKQLGGSEIYKKFLSELDTNPKMDDFNFVNQGVLLMLCYGLMVYPFEFWKNIFKNDENLRALNTYIIKAAKEHPKREIILSNLSELFNLDKKNMSDKDILKHLRNSISHARIKVDISANEFIFKDIDYKKKTEVFSAKITMDNLGVFLTGVGKYFCNELELKD